jgi:arylformamidase
MMAISGMKIYRGMSQAELDAAYNNLAAVADSQSWIAGWPERSRAVQARPDAALDMRYGDAPRALLDYFPCGAPGAPLFVFFHGGYWLRNHKDIFSFIAEGPLGNGFNVAVPGYTLAPEARLSQIVAEAALAVDFLAGSAHRLGFDRTRIIAGGWSAGGHLAATLMNHPDVSRVLGISGIYDLEPISLCDLNATLDLSADEVERLSPIRLLSKSSAPLTLAYGGEELPELQRQSADFAAAGKRVGAAVEAIRLSGRHHFSILDELSASDGQLVRMLTAER